jgi:large subunit ribosomal protein L28
MAGMEEDFAMSRRCELTAKGPQVGHKVSHSNIKTKRVQRPNLQRVKALVDGSPRRIRVCTRCLRSGRVTKVA